MKKIYSLVCFVLFFNLAKAQFPAPYCAEAYGSNVEPITSVVFGAIANTSTEVTGGTAHEDYTSMSTNITQGLTYAMSVQGNTDGSYTDYITVFIDWNQDGDFDDSGESFNIGTITNSTGIDGKTATGNVTVPIGAMLGATRMRVAKKWNSYQTPCNTGGYGEAEDYSVTVIAAPSCTGTPPIAIASGPASSCIDSMITVSLSGITAGTGLTYQWQSTTIGGSSWTAVSGATTAIATFAHPAGGRDYRCVVTCTSSTLSSNSSTVTVQSEDCSPPVNDDPCNAITLLLDSASNCQNTFYATATNDPTLFTCSTPNNTTWYKYTPTATGVVQFTLAPPASGDTLYGWLGVFTATGSCPGALTFVDETNAVLGGCKSFGIAGNANTQFSATLTAGIEYYFMIDGVSGDVGKYCISIQTPPAAPATCATNTLPANAAIDVTAPVTTLKWSSVTLATSYDVYFGIVNPPTIKIGTALTDSIIITGLAYNTTYYWYVVPKNIGGSPTGCDANTTSFTTVAPPPPPTNDECSGAITVTAGTPLNATSLSATQSQPGEVCGGFTGNANDDVWFTFTANQSGDATIIETPPVGSSFDGVIIVYSGTCGALTSIGCADATFAGGTETVTVTGLNAGETYYFRVYGYGGVGTESNFTITASGSALPVSITKFSGERKGGSNILAWSTATEINSKGFELQRSSTGDKFLPLVFVESKAVNGSSSTALNYQAIDAKPYAGNTYYRLKQIDKNGKTNFSNIILIKGEKITTISVTDVYPNPANKVLNMIVASPNDEKVNIIISDITGKILQKQVAQLTSGNNNLKLNVGNLATGSYMLKVVCNNGCNSSVVKFVKE